ncbi:hypothetical protein EW146_g5689 [Bondarzewia mesenterica]|uniref:EF-hand domain-containing protein n=1 Tax=Bondarzewia mesenterica TaxID=1095465 RepID=A0A4V3XER7_9AGAM|nr:hypothetical protein EW146_g5689 [Bondarzewia mesenterica]
MALRAPSMRRDPSWRKPVPAYIPSPPTSSPSQAPGKSVGEQRHLDANGQYPPLPDDWRGALQRARSVSPTGQQSHQEHSRYPPMTFDPSRKQTLSVITNYRPPTPPMRYSHNYTSKSLPNGGENEVAETWRSGHIHGPFRMSFATLPGPSTTSHRGLGNARKDGRLRPNDGSTSSPLGIIVSDDSSQRPVYDVGADCRVVFTDGSFISPRNLSEWTKEKQDEFESKGKCTADVHTLCNIFIKVLCSAAESLSLLHLQLSESALCISQPMAAGDFGDEMRVHGPSGRDIYDDTLSGAQDRPFIPRLRSDPPSRLPPPRSLARFREQEGNESRKARLRELWQKLNTLDQHLAEVEDAGSSAVGKDRTSLTPESAKKIRTMYERELVGSCGGSVGWPEFKRYALEKEAELWHIFHDELDLDGNGHLDAEELAVALKNAGIELSSPTLSEFMTFLTTSPHSHAINFKEFRDFLLLLPRKASAAEIYQYYEVSRFLGDDGRGPARVNMEGDVILSAEDKPPDHKAHPALVTDDQALPADHDQYIDEDEDGEGEIYGHELDEDEEDHHEWMGGGTAIRFLLAGGIAGAVSRTCTAPFDRLKIFLITRPPDLGGTSLSPTSRTRGTKAIASAVARIYSEGGIRAFWIGNGLSVVKIFPESAIKFLAYETSKRMFARYVDGVDDLRDISGVSRFLSGGLGGISSQLTIYPIETLKTQMMSSTGVPNKTLMSAAKRVWALGGFRAYYRGLTIGLIGVFPYSAIDMSTFEALKLAYLRSTGKEEPGVLALLAFGSVSGSVGASSVYPMNLVRTRLQASGSPGHPQRYTGFRDVVWKTYERDGWRGFYRGLLPTLAKVVPAVSISYVVYEQSKRRLGV